MMVSLMERARRVAAVSAAAAGSVDREARFPGEAVASMKENGLLSVLVPKAWGGEGASPAEVFDVCRTLGEACSSAAMVFAMHQVLAAAVIGHGAGSRWYETLLKRMVTDQLLLASAASEVGIGGAHNVSVCAVDIRGDEFSLEKNALAVSYGLEADALVVSARRHVEARATEQILVVMTRDQYGLTESGSWDTLGMRGTVSRTLKIVGRGDIAQILPEPHQEIRLQTALPFSFLAWSAVWLGIAAAAVARARAFVRAETMQGRPTEHVSTALSEVIGQLNVMRQSISSVAARYERIKHSRDDLLSDGFMMEMNNLKINASRMVVGIVHDTMNICGLAGYQTEGKYSVARHLRDAYSASIMINNTRLVGQNGTLALLCDDEALARIGQEESARAQALEDA
jgi:acyl-CoA dehydrogenase